MHAVKTSTNARTFNAIATLNNSSRHAGRCERQKNHAKPSSVSIQPWFASGSLDTLESVQLPTR